jgi:hypothetical protein
VGRARREGPPHRVALLAVHRDDLRATGQPEVVVAADDAAARTEQPIEYVVVGEVSPLTGGAVRSPLRLG